MYTFRHKNIIVEEHHWGTSLNLRHYYCTFAGTFTYIVCWRTEMYLYSTFFWQLWWCEKDILFWQSFSPSGSHPKRTGVSVLIQMALLLTTKPGNQRLDKMGMGEVYFFKHHGTHTVSYSNVYAIMESAIILYKDACWILVHVISLTPPSFHPV